MSNIFLRFVTARKLSTQTGEDKTIANIAKSVLKANHTQANPFDESLRIE